MEGDVTRNAQHAGSWYSKNGQKLEGELAGWLDAATVTQPPPVKAVISPHAGYSYSGPNAAWAYQHLAAEPNVNRVFILGPSHKKYIDKCALTPCSSYATPLGNIPVDRDVIKTLTATGLFEQLTKAEDENEHSLEMQLPYIRKIFTGYDLNSFPADPSSKNITLVPIMVGRVSLEQQETCGTAFLRHLLLIASYGKLLLPYFEAPGTVFVISSDFCHWGERFDFTPHDKTKGEIWQSIEAMDRTGMSLIESQSLEGFHAYLKQTKNTICGRYPIQVLLQIMRMSASRYSAKFVKYEQSSKCVHTDDSSVSYAAAVISRIEK